MSNRKSSSRKKNKVVQLEAQLEKVKQRREVRDLNRGEAVPELDRS